MDKVYSHATRVHIWVGEKDSRFGSIWDDEAGDFMEVPDYFADIRAQRSFGAICDIVSRWQSTGQDVPHATYTSHSSVAPDVKRSFDTFQEFPKAAQQFPNPDVIHKALEHLNSKWQFRRENEGYSSDDDEESVVPDRGIDSTPEHAR
jgi:hypothetical protein